jgi:hypothetical protein
VKAKVVAFIGAAIAVMVLSSSTAGRLFAEDSRGPVPLVEAHEVMELFFEHEFETLKELMQKEPTKRNDWKGIFNGALELAEAHNLLFFRDDEDYMETDEWITLTVAGRDAALAIATSVKARDFSVIKSKYSAMVKSCNACHEEFQGDEPEVIEE